MVIHKQHSVEIWLFNAQSRVLEYWILENNEKATLNISIPCFHSSTRNSTLLLHHTERVAVRNEVYQSKFLKTNIDEEYVYRCKKIIPVWSVKRQQHRSVKQCPGRKPVHAVIIWFCIGLFCLYRQQKVSQEFIRLINQTLIWWLTICLQAERPWFWFQQGLIFSIWAWLEV